MDWRDKLSVIRYDMILEEENLDNARIIELDEQDEVEIDIANKVQEFINS